MFGKSKVSLVSISTVVVAMINHLEESFYRRRYWACQLGTEKGARDAMFDYCQDEVERTLKAMAELEVQWGKDKFDSVWMIEKAREGADRRWRSENGLA